MANEWNGGDDLDRLDRPAVEAKTNRELLLLTVYGLQELRRTVRNCQKNRSHCYEVHTSLQREQDQASGAISLLRWIIVTLIAVVAAGVPIGIAVANALR